MVREREGGWIRLAAPQRSGLLRALGGLIDYVLGEPLHFAMVRRMMLGLKQRAETSAQARPAVGGAEVRPTGINDTEPSVDGDDELGA